MMSGIICRKGWSGAMFVARRVIVLALTMVIAPDQPFLQIISLITPVVFVLGVETATACAIRP